MFSMYAIADQSLSLVMSVLRTQNHIYSEVYYALIIYSYENNKQKSH